MQKYQLIHTNIMRGYKYVDLFKILNSKKDNSYKNNEPVKKLLKINQALLGKLNKTYSRLINNFPRYMNQIGGKHFFETEEGADILKRLNTTKEIVNKFRNMDLYNRVKKLNELRLQSEAEVKKLESDLEVVKKKNAELLLQISQNDTHIQQHKADIEKLSAQAEEHKKSLEEHKEHNIRLKEETKQHEQKISEAQKHKAELESKITLLEKQNSDIKKELDEKHSAQTALEKSIAEMKALNVTLEEKLKEKSVELEKIQRERNEEHKSIKDSLNIALLDSKTLDRISGELDELYKLITTNQPAHMTTEHKRVTGLTLEEKKHIEEPTHKMKERIEHEQKSLEKTHAETKELFDALHSQYIKKTLKNDTFGFPIIDNMSAKAVINKGILDKPDKEDIVKHILHPHKLESSDKNIKEINDLVDIYNQLYHLAVTLVDQDKKSDKIPFDKRYQEYEQWKNKVTQYNNKIHEINQLPKIK